MLIVYLELFTLKYNLVIYFDKTGTRNSLFLKRFPVIIPFQFLVFLRNFQYEFC